MIPYTTDRRPDTGVTNVTMGIWLLIASEVMLFGALLSSYALLRTAAPAWPSGPATLSVSVGASTSTLVVVATALIWRARRADPVASRRWLAAASMAAVVFVLIQIAEYIGLADAGVRPASNTFFAMYFTLTALHVIHVITGAAATVWVWAGTRRVSRAMTDGRLRALAVYWIFVAALWIAIVALFYLA